MLANLECFMAVSLVAMFTCSFEAQGQVSLRRTVNADGIDAVELETPEFRVHFDTAFGGVPRHWYLRTATGWTDDSIINPHPGEAMHVVYETGQDSTQGMGSAPNRIQHPGDPTSDAYAYYARESLFEPPSGPNDSASYEVTGFAPFFWISHEMGDDALPCDPGTPVCDGTAPVCGVGTGWFLPYTSGCSAEELDNCQGRNFMASDIPIWFDGSASYPEGALFIGNETKLPVCDYAWYERLTRIRQGRFAARVRVSFEEASSQAYAGILFRRNVPINGEPSLQDALVSPGYAMFVNYAGVVQVHKYSGSGPSTIVWNAAGNVCVDTNQLRSAAGTLFELRTHNAIPGQVEIYANGVSLGALSEDDPILGEHFGLFANTSPGTSIKFTERNFYDVGIEFVVRYTGFADGSVVSDVLVHNAPGIPSNNEHEFYSAVAPWPFLNVESFEGMNTVWLKDECGDWVDEFLATWACGETCQALDPTLCPPNPIQSADTGFLFATLTASPGRKIVAWAGDASEQIGLYATVLAAEVDGSAAEHAHFGGDKGATGAADRGFLRLASSPLQWRQPGYEDVYPDLCFVQSARSFRNVVRWSNQWPLEYDPDRCAMPECDELADYIVDLDHESLAAGIEQVSQGGTLGLMGDGSDEGPLTIQRAITLIACEGPVTIGH